MEQFEQQYYHVLQSYYSHINSSMSYSKQLQILTELDDITDNHDIINYIIFSEDKKRIPYELTAIKPVLNVPVDMQYIHEQFMRLVIQPQPEQQSPEWFAARHQRITASSGASALNENHYENQISYLVQKCEKEPQFMDNKYVHHGKKYEEIATKVYEELYDSSVTEFGLLNHPDINFLGASPDGIVSMHTKSNPSKLNPRYGRMLEIKCPFTRKIKTSGNVDGEICPHNYWVQVQLQLECCKLLECDFWQCSIDEFNSRQEYLCDIVPTETSNQDDLVARLKANPKISKGPIIQLLPIKCLNKKNCEWDSKYIYPPLLNRTVEEHDIWILDMMSSWKTKFPDLASKYIWDKVLYWKIKFCHNVTILHNQEWFNNILPQLEAFWNKVLYFRINQNELHRLMQLIRNKSVKKITDIPAIIPEIICTSDDEL